MLIIGSTPESKSGEGGKAHGEVTSQQNFKQDWGQCTENLIRRKDKTIEKHLAVLGFRNRFLQAALAALLGCAQTA